MKKDKLTLRDEIYDVIKASFADPMEFDALNADILTGLEDNFSDFITEKILSLIKKNMDPADHNNELFHRGYNERNAELAKDIKTLII